MFVGSTPTAPTRKNVMDEEARSQIHLRNRMKEVYSKLKEHETDSEFYYLWIDKSIVNAIDEEFWSLLDRPDIAEKD